jgi:hypothetical protein
VDRGATGGGGESAGGRGVRGPDLFLRKPLDTYLGVLKPGCGSPGPIGKAPGLVYLEPAGKIKLRLGRFLSPSGRPSVRDITAAVNTAKTAEHNACKTKGGGGVLVFFPLEGLPGPRFHPRKLGFCYGWLPVAPVLRPLLAPGGLALGPWQLVPWAFFLGERLREACALTSSWPQRAPPRPTGGALSSHQPPRQYGVSHAMRSAHWQLGLSPGPELQLQNRLSPGPQKYQCH